MKPAKPRAFCEVEWPTFNVGWPTEGTLDLAIMAHVRDIVTGDPGHPDQFPYIDSWYIRAACPPDWPCFHTPWRYTAILVNRKVKEKKFEVHHTSELEPPDLPPYIPLVCPAAPDSPRPESDSEDPNGKEAASEPNPSPCHPTTPSLYRPFAFDGPGERYKPLGKVSELWEANKQKGRNPAHGAMPPAPGSWATITPGRRVIHGQTHAVCVSALHYHQRPELAAAHPSILRGTTGCNRALDQHHAQTPTQLG
jgi:hypothetical protein